MSNKVKNNYMWGEVVSDNKRLVPGPDGESPTMPHKREEKNTVNHNRNLTRGTGLVTRGSLACSVNRLTFVALGF